MARDTVVVGVHSVLHALRGGTVLRLMVIEGRLSRRLAECVDQARAAGITVTRVSRRELQELAGGVRHQGVAAQVSGEISVSDLSTWLQQLEGDALLLVLDGVTDPHNLGACLRSADALGCDAVILPRDHSADPASPVAQKTACGALAHLRLFQETNLSRALAQLKEAGFWVTCLAGEATQPVAEIDLRGRMALVLGSEGAGVRRLVREASDHLAAIPMAGHVESLNVSVACGIVLYEAARQRGMKG